MDHDLGSIETNNDGVRSPACFRQLPTRKWQAVGKVRDREESWNSATVHSILLSGCKLAVYMGTFVVGHLIKQGISARFSRSKECIYRLLLLQLLLLLLLLLLLTLMLLLLLLLLLHPSPRFIPPARPTIGPHSSLPRRR